MTTIPPFTLIFDPFVFIGFVILLLWYYSTCTFGFWKRQKIAFKQPVPFFGNVGKFALQIQPIHECLREIYAHFRDEPYGGFFQMRDPTLLVRDPDLVHAILVRDFKNFVDRGVDLMYPDKKLNPLKIHLFGLEGDQWRALRRKLSPIFTPTKLKRMQDQVTVCIDKLNVLLEKELERGAGDMDLKIVFERLTMNVIGSCAFGIECNTFEQNSEFMVQGKKVFQPNWLTSVRALVTAFNKKLLKWLRLPDLPMETTKFFMSLVLDTMKYRRRNKIERPDSLQLMMGLQNAYDHPENAPDDCKGFNSIHEDRFDEVHIAANSFLFFTAGFETTASTLSYCLYELALNPIIQKRLREELENEYNENDHCWSVDSLRGNSYLDAVISETLRKYPPLPWVFRRTDIDWTIPGTKKIVPKYTKVIIPVWSIHHDWRNFPNPECFDPERFLGEMAATVRSGSFIPFGDGPRNCIGARFAKMEIRLALADMIRKYDITPCSQTRIPLRYVKGSPLLSSADGLWMNISKRKT